MHITLRNFTEDDYVACLAIRNAVLPEYPMALEEWRHYDAHRDSRCRFGRIVAEHDGVIVGYGTYQNLAWMFHPQKFGVYLAVQPEHQGQGVGRALYARLLTELEPFNPVLLRCEAREDMERTVAFLAHRGFEEEQRAWESRLDLERFVFEPWSHAITSVLDQGIKIVSIRELETDPERDRKLHALVTELDRDVPTPEPITEVPFEVFVENVLRAPRMLPDAWLIAMDGDEYVGMSQLGREQDGLLTNGLTGVKRSHRRRGIALALKLHNIRLAQSAGYRSIKTWNATNNRPMLAINERLGFVKQPAWIDFVRRLERVAQVNAVAQDHTDARQEDSYDCAATTV